MKKFLILINLFLLVGAFHSIKASEVIEYDFTVTDGYGYDLETGKYEVNINLSSTSKILLGASNSGNEINFNTLDLHHLLLFDKYNKYIGYMNGDGTDLENSKYLGDVDYVTNYPSNAYMFAIVNYNYEETRDLVFLTNPTIDDIAWEDLSYRDIFEGTDLITNGDFADTTPTVVNTRNVFNYVDAVADNTEITLTTYDSRDVMHYYNDSTANNIRIMEGDFTTSTQYTISMDLYSTTNAVSMVLYYTDATYDVLTFTHSIWDSLEFTTDAGKTVDYIRGYYLNTTDVYIDINAMQIEKGTTATDFIEYEITVNYPDNWTHVFTDNSEVVDGVFIGYGNNISTRFYNQQTIVVNDGDNFYLSSDLETNISNNATARLYLGSLEGGGPGYIGGITSMQNYSFIGVWSNVYNSNMFAWDFRGDTLLIDDFIAIDNVIFYNLTDIGFITMPTTTEFETMQDFYDLYIDAPEEITYNDVFTNNLIINFNFDTDDLSYWRTSSNSNIEVIDNTLKVSNDIDGLVGAYSNSVITDLTHLYYYNVIIYPNNISANQFRIFNSIKNTDFIVNVWNDYSIIIIGQGTSVTRQYFNVGAGYDYYLDDVILLDLTDLFGANLEPDTAYIEDLHDIWLDPVGDNYLIYYDTTDLDVLVINYTNDPGIPVEPDIDTGLDSFLDNINMNNTGGKVGLGIITMIFLAIVIGLLTKSTPVVLIVMTVSFITFTVIGWFSIWITIVILIVIVIIGLFSLNRRV